MKNHYLFVICLLLFIPLSLLSQERTILYVDDTDPGYQEYGGPWRSGTDHQGSETAAWGATSREVPMDVLDYDEAAEWTPTITTAGYYATYFILPRNANGRNNAMYVVNAFGSAPDTMRFNQATNSGNWIFLGIYYFPIGGESSVKVVNDDKSTTGYMFRADAVRLIHCMDTKDIEPVRRNEYKFGEVSMGEYKEWTLRIYNLGGTPLTIQNTACMTSNFVIRSNVFPQVLDTREYIDLTVRFLPDFETTFYDSMVITSDDPDEPVIKIPVQGKGTATTVIVNNDDGFPFYLEHTGAWRSSNGAAEIEGLVNPTSKYVIVSTDIEARCQFIPTIPKSGLYNIYYCGPATQNAATHAMFELHPFGAQIDTVWIDQNASTGDDWKLLGTKFLIEGGENSVYVVNDGTGAGYALRADLIKFTYVPSVPDINVGVSEFRWIDVPIHSSASKKIRVNNLGSQNLVIENLSTKTPQFAVLAPTALPFTIPALDSASIEVAFIPTGVLNYEDKLTIESNDIDQPSITLKLTGNGIGDQLVVDDSDSALCTIWGNEDTTWHFSASITGYKETSLFAYKYRSPYSYVEWQIDVPATRQYEVYASSVPSGNSTHHAPYVINVPGGVPDTIEVDQCGTTPSNIWVYLGTYSFIEGVSTSIKLVNDTTRTYQDTMLVIRADAVKLSQPVAVELSAFYAAYEEGNIAIHWETRLEKNHRGFNIYRTASDEIKPEPRYRLNRALISGKSPYKFVDDTAGEGTLYYWLEDVSLKGLKTLHGPISANSAFDMPAIYSLSQNYPNPFNPKTVISYSLPKTEQVQIKVYNILGELVKTLVDAKVKAGQYKISWFGNDENGLPAASGIYFLQIHTKTFTQTRKMILIR
ncbi:choice-of-anchor D domain-containing protein [candidate division KSB1 bacterium]|nr:choice-of-anchor D domain-containing protein [candidate division KSB1 bacterium]